MIDPYSVADAFFGDQSVVHNDTGAAGNHWFSNLAFVFVAGIMVAIFGGAAHQVVTVAVPVGVTGAF